MGKSQVHIRRTKDTKIFTETGGVKVTFGHCIGARWQVSHISPSRLPLLINANTPRRHDFTLYGRVDRKIEEGFRQTAASTRSEIYSVGLQIDDVRKDIQARQSSLEATSSRLIGQATAISKDITNSNRNNLEQHERTRAQVARETTNAINVLCSKLDDLPQELARAQNPPKSSGREIRFYGKSRKDILLPLLLLQPGFRQAIFTMVSQNSNQFTAQDLYLLHSKFENLIVSATQEAAAESPGSTASSFDNWIYSQDFSSLPRREPSSDKLVSRKGPGVTLTRLKRRSNSMKEARKSGAD